MREDLARAQDVLTIAAMTVNALECAFVVVFGSPLFCAGECCVDLCIVVVFEGRFFLINGALHQSSVDEKKNRVRRHMILRSYCHYYSRYYYRMTTIVTTVATRHGITTLLYRVG